tara:strand:- start:1011 stop:1124 length:114 start_codon:yes stop_codon:yes gene_type:complete
MNNPILIVLALVSVGLIILGLIEMIEELMLEYKMKLG